MTSVSLRLLILLPAVAGLACGHTSTRQPPETTQSAALTPVVAAPAVPAAEAPQPTAVAEPAVAVTEPEVVSVQFTAPANGQWDAVPAVATQKVASRFTHVAVVTQTAVPLYSKAQKRVVVGYTNVGSRVPADPTGSACPGGEWVAVTGGAFLCTGDGAELLERGDRRQVLSATAQRRVPKTESPTPYGFAKARTGAPLFKRMPSPEELDRYDEGRSVRGLVRRFVKGTLLMAFVRKVDGPEPFLELLSGELIREKDLDEYFPDPPMRGELLEEGLTLPLAFARQETPVYCVGDGDPKPCGSAAKHARFAADERAELGDQELIVVGEGLAVPRQSVRVAEKIDRPAGISAREQWIHIDLTEQTLVAYQGDRPVLATLIASGKEEAATPNGLYQVNRIYKSKPMNGVDELGPYQVQEVPWAMYFRGNYAVHGAYWHNAFGDPRSHGCVNLPPADARWLFHWSKPRLPTGWTADVSVRGPRVYITGKTPSVPKPVADSRRNDDARAAR